ncbi:MAG: capsule assembly Wzi family protein, partial [Gemmatimonadota bacterium]
VGEGSAPRGVHLNDGWLGTGWDERSGRLLAGTGYEGGRPWSGPRPVPDAAGVASAVRWTPSFGRHAGMAVEPVLDGDSARLRAGYVHAAGYGVELWIGRRAVGYGVGAGGRIVFDGAVPLDGGGLRLADPRMLPGPLQHLGPVRFDMVLSRVDDNGEFERPWLWGMRGAVSPHERVTLGLTRGIMFGGGGNTSPSLRALAYMLVGKHAGRGGEFDNQVLALDVRWRPPFGPVPFVVYGEWGMEDSAGAWRDVPGVIVGAEVAALPGEPNAGVGVEHVRFWESCCGNPLWYRNWAFQGGWTDGGEPLGHPLGGHGEEWLAYGHADLFDARLRLRVRGFLRRRGSENLFAPARESTSGGGAFEAELRAASSVEAYLSLAFESADVGVEDEGWRASSTVAGVRVLLGPGAPDRSR